MVKSLGPLLLAAMLLGASGCSAEALTTSQKPQGGKSTVVRITDGDTIAVKDKRGQTVRVRIAYIDTPEVWGGKTECGGAQASAAMKELVRPGDKVKLKVVDVDRYGRTVAEVFKGKVNLGLKQVSSGRAMVYRFQGRNFPGAPRYDAAAARARSAGLGVWGSCSGDFHKPI